MWKKQQGRLGSYNKQYTLYKVSGIPKCVLVWIRKQGLHLAGVGKQANEVCSKRKLSLKTTQQQAIMSMSPSQPESSTVTKEASRGTESHPPPMGVATREWYPVFSFDILGTFLSARPISSLKTNHSHPLIWVHFSFDSFLSTNLFAWFIRRPFK